MGRAPDQMKWWGWGDEGTQFEIADKPELWPFIQSAVGIQGDPTPTPPVRFEDIRLPEPNLHRRFVEAMAGVLGPGRVRSDRRERVIHAYGKSFRDLWRIRRGQIDAAPDAVIYPTSEDEIVAVVRAAATCDVVLIPFGGGSNIAGCLEATHTGGRMVVSLDLKCLDQVLSVDDRSCTARIQAGVMGPHLEQQLQAHGFTLGHFPDSFLFSTLGGWIATRSAGMQSDKYGKIEDMVLALRVVTPVGTIVTRTVPKSSNGIDVNHLCIGSEGILGIITEATMQVHRCPRFRVPYGYLFRDFESGLEAVRTCVDRECAPVVTRLNDPAKTALSFAYKTAAPPARALLAKAVKAYLGRVRQFDFGRSCLLLTVFEGDRHTFHDRRRRANRIYRQFGAFNLGTEPGHAFERGKYDFPYLRDFVMDRNIMADVSETSTVWSNLLPLYHRTMEAIERAIRSTGVTPYVGCHISHTYHTGASLYFTFGCQQTIGRELQQYLAIKKSAEDAFLRGGATLSHHHAVGYEHQPWLEDDISAAGITAVKGLKAGLDPTGIMNPGKIIPGEHPFADWGLKEEARQALERVGG